MTGKEENAGAYLGAKMLLDREEGGAPGYYAKMSDALRDLLIEKGLITAAQVRREIERLEAPGIHLGAKIAARAWVDPVYKDLLLSNGTEAAEQLGIKVGEAQLVVVENTERVHNLITCTLCSCYPRSILGQPPAWYRNKVYRARSVNEPRKVLEEFGTRLPENVVLHVRDSNADMRYMVLPRRPAGTEGWNEEKLQGLVTRDSLIGIAQAMQP
jgi:nitrile hydratase